MLLLENIFEALNAIRSNLLRSSLTIIIIALGITAMVGVLTSIDGIKYWMSVSFSTLGANSFKIQNRELNVRIGGKKARQPDFPVITYDQALQFKKQPAEGLTVSVTAIGSFAAKVRYKNLTTNNNILVTGVDENFLIVESYKLTEGRSINTDDVKNNLNVAVIGHEVREKLFPAASAVGQDIFVGRNKYRVIGVLAKKGTVGMAGGDKICILPVTTVLNDYPDPTRSFSVNAIVDDAAKIIPQAEAAIGRFRLIRHLKPTEDSNFSIVLSDSFVSSLMENLSILTMSATAIALITLFGASIGLMNMMLVSVTERTMEIGLRKALGATRFQIMVQFLTEAITICQLGGLLGIVLGVGMGNLLSLLLEADFIIPYFWIGVSVALCFLVGVAAGLYPAIRAASLDPIDSLRYE